MIFISASLRITDIIFGRKKALLFMDKNKKEEQTESTGKEQHYYFDLILGAIFTVLHLSLAYLGGVVVIQHFINMFTPNHVLTTEAPAVVGGLLVVALAIFGAYGALHYLFINTRLEKLFPGYWK